jgi:translation initiation factor 1 (eIF-1/SUI1)
MKRMLKIIYSSIIILIVPFSIALGQDKKSEQKIKIIVDDGSGSKVLIDTVYKDSSAPDSMKLKDGSVVYLKHSGDESERRHHDGKKHIYVTSSSSDKETGKAFDMYVSENENESTTEKARYVIAKDGMVVTIEGNDESKAKELAKEIENKLGVNGAVTEKKETVKVVSKKSVKK